MIIKHENYVRYFNNNKCSIIEGKIHDFISSKKDPKGVESFIVNGVFFSYAETSQSDGFNKTNLEEGQCMMECR